MSIDGERNDVRFGQFVVDRKAGELRKRGIRVRVPDQSINALCLLLERPGEVITREDLCRRLWPNGTIVEFEHGLNNAIRRLRAALEDSAGKPRFIETLPKHGYRFIFPFKGLSPTEGEQTRVQPDARDRLSGKQFGPYQVLDKLGEGATASVYRGFDPRLERFVALKFLAADLLNHPSLRRHFEDEARLASVLGHTNVCTIYDVGGEEGRPFIAMELLEGATLERLLEGGPLPLASALNYSRQIAAALDAAHQNQIVHRDIKPANIFVTDRQVVKVTDFGIAHRHALTPGSALRSPPDLPVAGTPGYVAPEHLDGKEASPKGDLFAFGVVLHEMLTGRRPLEQERTQPKSRTRAERSIHILDRILRQCLQNDPQKRYESAEDVIRDLDLAINALKTEPRPANPFWAVWRLRKSEAAQPAPKFWRIRGWALLGLAIALAAALAIPAINLARESAENGDPSLTVRPLTSSPGNELQPSLSPDGNRVAFAFRGDRSANYHIYIKAIGSGEPVAVTSASVDDMSPSWSPDGREIVFLRFVANHLAFVMVIPSTGGVERKLTRILVDRSLAEIRASWSPDGRWIASSEAESSLGPMRLLLISTRSGEKRRLAYEPPAVRGDLSPSFSPDGRYLAYARHISPAVSDIYILDLRKQNGNAYVSGARQLTNWNRMAANPLWSGDGREIFFVGEKKEGLGRRIWRIPAFGRASARLLDHFGEDCASIALCPLRRRLVYARQSPEDMTIWRLDVKRGAHATEQPGGASRGRLIASTREDTNAQFSPDGKRIAYQSARSGSDEIWMANSDGSGLQQLTHLEAPMSGYPRWSPDGRHIVFHSRPNGYANIYVLAVDTGTCRPLTSGTTNDTAPTWSHDGEWIYFGSTRQDGSQIWKVPAKGGPATRVTKNGGAVALESVDGRLLFFSKFYEPGLWMVSPAGGAEQQLLASLYGKDNFAVSKRGVFFVGSAEGGQGAVNFMSLPSRTTLKLAQITSPIGSGLTVSPDESRILYSQAEYTNSDLMLVDHLE